MWGREGNAIRISLALGALAALACVLPAGADAGGFYVCTCTAAAAQGYDTSAFDAGASSARMLVKRACNPHGRGLRGLITTNRVAGRSVRAGEYAAAVFPAPPGTRLAQ